MDLVKEEAIKKRLQEHTELYKNILNDPDNHDGVITHLEPDILEGEAKWALGSITMNKASGGDGIPAQFSSVRFSHTVVSDSLRPHESQHARPPCPSPTPRVHSDSHPLSQ